MVLAKCSEFFCDKEATMFLTTAPLEHPSLQETTGPHSLKAAFFIFIHTSSESKSIKNARISSVFYRNFIFVFLTVDGICKHVLLTEWKGILCTRGRHDAGSCSAELLCLHNSAPSAGDTSGHVCEPLIQTPAELSPLFFLPQTWTSHWNISTLHRAAATSHKSSSSLGNLPCQQALRGHHSCTSSLLMLKLPHFRLQQVSQDSTRHTAQTYHMMEDWWEKLCNENINTPYFSYRSKYKQFSVSMNLDRDLTFIMISPISSQQVSE